MITNTKERPSDLTTCDINGDQLTDLVVTYLGDNEVGWIGNLGDGVFSSGPFLVWPDLTSPTSASCGDLDGDEDPDVVASSGAGDLISWYVNQDGQFIFSPNDDEYVTDQADYPRSVYVIDVEDANFIPGETGTVDRQHLPHRFRNALQGAEEGKADAGVGSISGAGNGSVPVVVDLPGRDVHELVRDRAAQAKAGAGNGKLWGQVAHITSLTAQDQTKLGFITACANALLH